MRHSKRHDRRLLAYLDGELGQDEASQMAGHVAGCVRCGEKMGRFQADLEQIQRVFDSPPGHGIAPSVEQIQRRAYRLNVKKVATYTGLLGATCAVAFMALWSSSMPAPEVLQTAPPLDAAWFAKMDAEIDAIKEEVAQLQQAARAMAPVSLQFHEEEVAAILVQAGKNLEREFGLTNEARQRYQWAADAYGGSAAGAEAKMLLAKMGSK